MVIGYASLQHPRKYLLGDILIAADYAEIAAIPRRFEIDRSTPPMRNGYEIQSQAKTGSFTPTRIKPKRSDAPNSAASTGKGNGAMAIPQRASVEIMAISATEAATIHVVGRSPQQ